MRCEWCELEAGPPVEIKRLAKGIERPTGMLVYACQRHVHLANQIAAPRVKQEEAAQESRSWSPAA